MEGAMRDPVCVVLALSLLVGCVSAREMDVERVLDRYADELASPDGLRVDGYVTQSGITYELPTTVRREGDRLVFTGKDLEYSRPKVAEVRGILFEKLDAGKTAGNTGKGVLVAIGVTLLVVLTLGASLAAS
jgi:hypothetical protein